MCPATKQAFDRLCSAKINNHQTEFVYKKFMNSYFLIITQYLKITNICTVKTDDPGVFPGRQTDTLPLTITSNFGVDSDELHTAIKFLMNNSNLKLCPTQVVISLGLKEINRDCLQDICSVLDEIVPEVK